MSMVSRPVERRIYEKYNHRCVICDEETAFDKGEVDHIIPKVKGGTDDPINLQWLCHRCNRLKGSTRTSSEVRKLLGLKTLEEDIRTKFEEACDSFLSEPRKILTMYSQIKSMDEQTLETVVSFMTGTIWGFTMTYIFAFHKREPREWEMEEITKLLKRRAPEMRTVFQNAMRQ